MGDGSIARMKPTAAVRNSVIVQRSDQSSLLFGKLGDRGIFDIQTVIEDMRVILCGRHGAW